MFAIGFERISRGSAALAAGLTMLGGHAAVCNAQDIAPFRFTGMEGYASVRYLSDEFTTQGQGARSRQAIGDWREEVFVMTHSYVYHPNFLALDIGGGPILQQARAATDTADTSSSAALHNLSTRATFLRDKPVQGSLFYDHLNPTLAVSPGSVMMQQHSKYGFDFVTLVPLPINVDASRSHSEGSSVERIVDDRIDQLNLRASQQLGRLGLTQFRHQATDQESRSGSPNLPIQRTAFARRYSQLDTRLRFGPDEAYDLFNQISLDTQTFGATQGSPPERKDERLLVDFRGRHSERLNSFATYNYSATDQGRLTSTLNAGSAGMGYAPAKNLSLRLGAHAEDNRATLFTVTSRGVDGSVQHSRPLGPGRLSMSYTLRYDQRDQRASAPRASVVGERIVLAGTTPVALFQQRVVSSSLVVSNTARTQTFNEGIDYAVSVVGLQTRLQRMVGGSILDGQEVLVDYAYDVGGTFAFDQTDQVGSVDWRLASYLDVYVRYLDSTPHLTSGAPTTPLNAVRSALYGTRADVPLGGPIDLSVGGFYEQEDRHETIAPYQRQQYEMYAQTDEPFFSQGNVRLSARRVDQTFTNSPQNVHLTGYDLRLWARHPLGVDLTTNATYERDTGGAVPRTRLLGTAKAAWRYRRASLTIELTRLREVQGDFERRRAFAQLLFRRDF